ncbi:MULTISPECIES: hypothetical protein [unclassified Lentimonas]|uniref:hypothetical protein n=1 Tax=unclassified Lentimonas TaxID=2630993 RepID=UPI0013239378|nr:MULTISPECIES: hypothetical protein [unclassified Lentimonas]CAA6692652.1 Unannotated [Lentimonas sp. CC19]CAA6696988.1 Unannotated [Lentimonas sp. CC10]CAA7071012.1 Unannotated [Lentimonas sp. CC11]
MKDIYDALDCECPDEEAHEVVYRLTNINYDKALDGFFLNTIRSWYDRCSPDAARGLLAYCACPLEDSRSEAPTDPRWFQYEVLRPLLESLHMHVPECLEHFPHKVLWTRTDVETLKGSCERYIASFWNQYFMERPMNRSWLENISLLRPQRPLPILTNLKPEAIASQLCADSKEDLDLAKTLSYVATDSETGRSDEKPMEALFSNYQATFEKLSLQIQLEQIRRWHDSLLLQTHLLQKPCLAVVKGLAGKSEGVLGLNREALLTLMYCADNSRSWLELSEPIQGWLGLPEPIRMGCFKQLCRLELPLAKSNSDTVSFLPDTEERDSTRDLCFWLVRPDGELYLSPILEWLQALSEESQLEVLSHLLLRWREYTEVIAEALRAVLQDFAARIHKLPLPAAVLLISGSYFRDHLDQNALSEIFLGRMRQVDASSAEAYFRYFSKPYKHLLDRDPFKALRRLLDALVVAKSPIADLDLSFVDDLGDFYMVPTSPLPYERVDPDAPAKWLMQKLFEWMLRYVTGGVWKEQGLQVSICREDMDLDSIRRFWADYCWRKLDLKKTAKRKNPADLTEDDLVEPRATWRIAHLKSLGDLGDDLGNKAHRRIHAISKGDPDPDVRQTAQEVYNKTLRERMRSAENPFYSFIKVTMWFRIANLESLGLGSKIDEKAATSNRNRELRLAKAIYERDMTG